MAHKAGGSTRNGRDSESKRLGVKIFGGQTVVPGNIIVRAAWYEVSRRPNVGCGKDHAFAKAEGTVAFLTKGPKSKKFVTVLAQG